jgi:hypothetical protein
MSPAARAFASWLAGAGAALGVVVALGLWPTLRWAGPDALGAIAGGGGVALAGALLGAVPVLVAVSRGGAERPHVVAAWSMALRSAATLAGALTLALASPLGRVATLVWVGLAYGALLVVETRWTVRWLAGVR